MRFPGLWRYQSQNEFLSFYEVYIDAKHPDNNFARFFEITKLFSYL